MTLGNDVGTDDGVTRLRRFHHAMVLSREIELHCTRQTGHWYPSIGEEATIVGTYGELVREDFAVPHYRGALIIPWLRGRPLVDVLGCLHYNKQSPTRGRLVGGFAGDIERRVWPYVTMVLGPSIAIAVGAALAFKHRQQDGVAVASFGDGTAGTGDFHESLNLAATLRAPVVFVCQNNQFSISTYHTKALAGDGVAAWAMRYDMPATRIDGNDVIAVAETVRAATIRARNGGGPTLIEAVTYRRTGHFIADPAAYRDAADAEHWAQQDPIDKLERHLVTLGAPATALAGVWEEARASVAWAAETAVNLPALDAGDVGIEDAYARG